MDVTDTSSGSVLVATLTQSHSKPRHHGYSVSHKTEAPPQGLPGGVPKVWNVPNLAQS